MIQTWQNPLKCSKDTCGLWLPYWTAQVSKISIISGRTALLYALRKSQGYFEQHSASSKRETLDEIDKFLERCKLLKLKKFKNKIILFLKTFFFLMTSLSAFGIGKYYPRGWVGKYFLCFLEGFVKDYYYFFFQCW